MHAKSLLHEMESYLRTEVELSQRPPVMRDLSVAQKMESDRSRLLREVQIEARQDPVNESVPFRRIMVAVDSSPQATAAIDLAAKLGVAGEVKYALVNVVDEATGIYEGFAPPVSIVGERCLRREKASILLKSMAERLVPHGRAMDERPLPDVEQLVREGPVVAKLIEAAREFGADLIVIGTHGRRGISHLLMGSTAEGVLRQAPCPVLSVTAKAAE
jgi:nucleotide-binding universal stress UspA family protein